MIYHYQHGINCVGLVPAENVDNHCSMGPEDYRDRFLLGANYLYLFLLLLAAFQLTLDVRFHLVTG